MTLRSFVVRLLPALLGCACDVEPDANPGDDDLTHYVDEDPGSACIDPASIGGQPVEVLVAYTCYSGSTKNMDATCEVHVDTVDKIIDVTARYEYDLPSVVTDDCQIVTATCTSDGPVPSGTYTLRYAGEVIEVALARNEPGAGWLCTGVQ